MTITATVNNLPDTIATYLAKNNGVLYITVTPYDGELWYYGLWYKLADAEAQAKAESKLVLTVKEV